MASAALAGETEVMPDETVQYESTGISGEEAAEISEDTAAVEDFVSEIETEATTEPEAEAAQDAEETAGDETADAEEMTQEESVSASESETETTEEITEEEEENIEALEAGTTVSGKCGANLTWTLSDTGVLTISGSGAMYDYSSSASYGPWSVKYASSVKSVVISGATSIGACAFAYCYSLESISIPSSVKSIGDDAFRACYGLTSITIPEGVTSIGSSFQLCSSLTSITIPESVTSISKSAFMISSTAAGGNHPQDLTIYGNYGSYAQIFAKENNITFVCRTLSKGMTGNDVKLIQQKLYDLGYLTATPDGSYGAKTEAAVWEFQKANGLANPDGKVGNWTRNKLENNPVAKSSKIVLTRTLKKGMTGNDVLAVQKRLAELGYLTATPDGNYGAKTEYAVRAFQLINGLGYSDGQVGNWTLNKLNGTPTAMSASDASSRITLSRTLKQGMKGFDVLKVQKRLYDLGYLTSTPDGNYGAKTAAAVSTFQIANGLGYSDGQVGNWTAGKMNGSPVSKASYNENLWLDFLVKGTYKNYISETCAQYAIGDYDGDGIYELVIRAKTGISGVNAYVFRKNGTNVVYLGCVGTNVSYISSSHYFRFDAGFGSRYAGVKAISGNSLKEIIDFAAVKDGSTIKYTKTVNGTTTVITKSAYQELDNKYSGTDLSWNALP